MMVVMPRLVCPGVINDFFHTFLFVFYALFACCTALSTDLFEESEALLNMHMNVIQENAELWVYTYMICMLYACDPRESFYFQAQWVLSLPLFSFPLWRCDYLFLCLSFSLLAPSLSLIATIPFCPSLLFPSLSHPLIQFLSLLYIGGWMRHDRLTEEGRLLQEMSKDDSDIDSYAARLDAILQRKQVCVCA